MTLLAAGFLGIDFVHLAVGIVIVAAIVALVCIYLRVANVTIPPWVVQVFWVIVAAVVIIVAIHLIASLW